MRRIVIVALSALGPCAVAGAAEPPPKVAAAPARAEQGPAGGRLKFKSRGPVCLCSTGLSERDIAQAAHAAANRSTTSATRSAR